MSTNVIPLARAKNMAAIVAVAENGIIGNGSKIPWDLPSDRRHFKRVTMDSSLIMGRKTYESIGRPLPGRENIVVTKSNNFCAAGCTVTHSVRNALRGATSQRVFFIGGEKIYKHAALYVDHLYMTVVRGRPDGNVYFPFGNAYGPYCMPNNWTLVYWEERRTSYEDEFACIFTEWRRKKKAPLAT